MTPPLTGLSRLFPAAALVAALGMPMTACAQAPEAAEAQTQTTKADADAKDVSPEAAQRGAEAAPAKEKTPEELAAEKQKRELDKLQREASLRAAKLKAELAPLMEQKQRIEAELALLQAKQQDAQAKAKMEKEEADFKAQLELAEMNRELAAMQAKFQAMQTQMQIQALEQQAELAELTAANAKLSAASGTLKAELALIDTERSHASIDKDKIQYPKKPLDGKTLVISDRRIPLNGGITRGSADFVTERIHYYNNLNPEAPIFIVIDSNPGGLVMEGYRIVTAMQNSKAPVHVVVKSYAASMAAVITTLAEESYAYPNAIILHHQMSSGMRGNLTQQKEQLEEGFEWARRLADPVAKKMGVDYDKFTELMYKNNSDGDWAEFADEAKKLKWVNHVVEEIRETALVSAPGAARSVTVRMMESEDAGQAAVPQAFTQEDLFRTPLKFEEKVDGNGKTYFELPKPGPYDFYFLHDPDGQYRLAK